MHRLKILLARVRGFFGKPHKDAELNAEVEIHLSLLTQENIRKGMTPQEARNAARREFGGVDQTKEIYREQRGLPFLETLLHDARFGLRSLRKRPGFTCLAILTLALGIGVNASLFTIVHGVLLSPLPFREPQRLVSLYERDVLENIEDNVANVVSGGNFEDWQRQATSFEQMSLIAEDSANLSDRGEALPEAIGTRFCSYNLFPMLGVAPIHGRLFTAEDDRAGANATMVLTYGLWKRRYAADPGIVGKMVLLDAKPYTVIGVLPAWMDYPDTRVQVWLPVYHEVAAADMHSRGNHRFLVTARLRKGVSVAAALAELDGIQQRIHQQFPDDITGHRANVFPLSENLVRDVKTSLYILMGAVSCVLLIACLNVANLFVARAATRRKEVAVRAALGGSRWRLMREQLTESLLLTFAGGALGTFLAYASIRWLVGFRADLPHADSIRVDGASLLFTVVITVLSGVFAGILPAFSATGSDPLEALKENSRALGGGKARSRLRTTLLTAEVSLTVMLLIGAGLLLKSFVELRSVKMGCATANVLTMGLNLPDLKYKDPNQFFERLLARVRAMPGVRAAGFVTVLPGNGHFEDNTFNIEGRPAVQGEFLDAVVRAADSAYFRAMDIPLLRGRIFINEGAGKNLNSVVISESMARKFFPSEEALGKRLLLGWDGKPQFEIVGIVGDVLSNVDAPPEPTMYFPLNTEHFGYGSLVVRSSVDVSTLALPIQKEIAAMDATLPVSEVLTMEQIIGKSTAGARFNAALVLFFAMLALLLAAIGLYGLLSYLVTQRTSEIGIRVALGAQRAGILRLMLLNGMRPITTGLLIGLAGGAVCAQFIRSILFGVQPFDLFIFATVGLVVLSVSVLACAFPAWRASRVDPLVAVRYE